MLFACYMGMGQVLDSASIIGKSITLGGLVVAQNNFPQSMNWEDAKIACAKLGNGWRLPTIYELNFLYKTKVKIGGFKNLYYWSSSEYYEHVFHLNFAIGPENVPAHFNGPQNYSSKSDTRYVRAIRDQTQFNSASIIGKPIKIGNLLVAQNDFPVSMNWEEAKISCAKLGNGWRLPALFELRFLYQKKVKIGSDDNAEEYYWSSTEDRDGAFLQAFNDSHGDCYFLGKKEKYAVRAIRDMGIVQDSASIIGKSIKIGNLVVAQNDFPLMMFWDEAKIVCGKLGYGWRLPSPGELQFLRQKKIQINDNKDYWSSSKHDSLRINNGYTNSAFHHYAHSQSIAYVRAIRGMGQAVDSASIIGKSIRIGNLVVAQNDFQFGMNWDDAKETCAALGDGWRLPTKDELNILYKNKDKIGGFVNDYYWSSTEGDNNYANNQAFNNNGGFRNISLQTDPNKVRAVRTFY